MSKKNFLSRAGRLAKSSHDWPHWIEPLAAAPSKNYGKRLADLICENVENMPLERPRARHEMTNIRPFSIGLFKQIRTHQLA
jgi:hypothetical protein